MEIERWISVDGDIFWYKKGTNISHREDGPAIEWADGTKSWMINNNLHRLDGPAVDYENGSKFYYKEGHLHRLDGPAIDRSDGVKEWWYEGKLIKCKDQETFERLLKLKAFW